MWLVYIDKTSESVPFYVGKGTTHRISCLERNKKHSAVSAKYGITREVILCTKDELFALEFESKMIEELNTFYLTNSLGCNFTIGGEGLSGYKHTSEEIALIAERASNYWAIEDYRIKHANAMVRTYARPEVKANQKAAARKRFSKIEEREKIANKVAKIWSKLSKKERKKRAVRLRSLATGRRHTVEAKAQISEQAKAVHRRRKSDAWLLVCGNDVY